jgi:hypothetical protein
MLAQSSDQVELQARQKKLIALSPLLSLEAISCISQMTTATGISRTLQVHFPNAIWRCSKANQFFENVDI